MSHLLQVHPHRIVKNIQFRLGFRLALCLGLPFIFVLVNLRSVDDVELHATQTLQDFIHDFGRRRILRKGFVEVVESEVVLLLGELDEFAQLRLNLRRVDSLFLPGLRCRCNVVFVGCLFLFAWAAPALRPTIQTDFYFFWPSFGRFGFRLRNSRRRGCLGFLRRGNSRFFCPT